MAGRWKEMKKGWKARMLVMGATPRPEVLCRHSVLPAHSVMVCGRAWVKTARLLDLEHRKSNRGQFNSR